MLKEELTILYFVNAHKLQYSKFDFNSSAGSESVVIIKMTLGSNFEDKRYTLKVYIIKSIFLCFFKFQV